jgi:hypothetical protein
MFKYIKAIIIVLLLLLASVALSQPTLTPFPESYTQYTYHIEVPHGTTAVSIFWYYGIEANTHMIYRSGYQRVKCCVIETTMYFQRAGTYIFTMWYEQGGKVQAMRRKYAVRHSWRI